MSRKLDSFLYMSFSMQSFPYENHCECYKKLASRLWPVLFTLRFFLYIHTLVLLQNKKFLCWPSQIAVHGYDHERSVHATDVTYTQKYVHGNDSFMLKLFEFANFSIFFFCLVLGLFYHVVLPVRDINCENCQLSTGAIKLSHLRTTFHLLTQTIMI